MIDKTHALFDEIDLELNPLGFAQASIPGASRGYAKTIGGAVVGVLVSCSPSDAFARRVHVQAAARIEPLESLLNQLREKLGERAPSVFTFSCPPYLLDPTLPGLWMVGEQFEGIEGLKRIVDATTCVALPYLDMASNIYQLHSALLENPRWVTGHASEVQTISVLLATAVVTRDAATVDYVVNRARSMPVGKWVFLKRLRSTLRQISGAA